MGLLRLRACGFLLCFRRSPRSEEAPSRLIPGWPGWALWREVPHVFPSGVRDGHGAGFALGHSSKRRAQSFPVGRSHRGNGRPRGRVKPSVEKAPISSRCSRDSPSLPGEHRAPCRAPSEPASRGGEGRITGQKSSFTAKPPHSLAA